MGVYAQRHAQQVNNAPSGGGVFSRRLKEGKVTVQPTPQPIEQSVQPTVKLDITPQELDKITAKSGLTTRQDLPITTRLKLGTQDLLSKANNAVKSTLTGIGMPVASQVDRAWNSIIGQPVTKESEAQLRDKTLRSVLNKNPYQDITPMEKGAYGIGETVGNIGEGIAATALTGNPAVGFGIAGGLQSYGEGGNLKDIAVNAGENAAFGALMEGTGKLIKPAVGNLPIGGKLGNVVKGTVGEGLSMGTAGVPVTMADNLINGKPVMQDVGSQALGNTIAGGVFGGIGGLAKKVELPKVESEIKPISPQLNLKDTQNNIISIKDVLPNLSKGEAAVTNENLAQKIRTPKIKNESSDLGLRSFQQNIKGADITTPQISEIIKDETYQKLHNKDLLQFAQKYVNDNPEKALKLVKSPQPATPESNAIAQELIRKAQNSGRYEDAIDLIETVSRKATDSGQAIQALSMWGRLTPEGMLRYAQRVFDNANAKNSKLNLKLDPELVDYIVKGMNAVNSMPTGRAQEIQLQKVMTKINESVPPAVLEKISSFQTLMQLLNPKTIIRNLGGNLGFAGLENIKDTVAAGLDKGVSLVTGKRTKVFPSLKTQFEGAKKGFKLGIEDVQNGINTSSAGTQFELQNKSMFKSKIGKSAENLLNYSLRVPDRAFYQSAYDESLRQQMRASKVMEPTQTMIDIANQDALYRTFQDDNVATKAFQGLKKVLNLNKSFGLGDMVLKYPKTPANLLVRSIEYSPAGFFKSIFELAKPLMKNEFNQKEFVESTSRALVGTTSLVGTGFLLHKLGIITGKREKDAEAANLLQQTGISGYKFNVSALKRFISSGLNPEAAKIQPGDTLVSYDWLQPMAVGIAVGANISSNQMKDASVENVGMLDSILTSIQEGTNTLAEQSLLRNLTDMFKGNKDLFTVITDTIKSAPASFVPTFINQIRQLTDNTSRDTYSKEFPLGMWQQFKNRIPVASKTLEPRITTMGQEQQIYQDGSNNLFNVFLNPAFVTKYKPTPEAKMVIDLFTQTGETKQFPRLVKDSFIFKKEKIILTPKEKVQLQKEVGNKTKELFGQLLKNNNFVKASPEDQINVLYKKLDEAGEYGKNIIKRQRGLIPKLPY